LFRTSRRGAFAFILTGILCLVIASFNVGPSVAAESSVLIEAAKRKINLAGRQRMLSQRIAMQACMAQSGVLVETSLSRGRAAADLFERTMDGLQVGDEEQGLSVETHPEVLSALSKVDGLWQSYLASVDAFLDQPGEGPLRMVHARNGAVLVNMNSAVGVMEGIYGDGLISPEIAGALNIAGRQRMLIMKALKEACMITRGFAAEEDRKALAKTISLFDTSLYKLRQGNVWDQIIAPPSFEIEMQLELVQMIWDWMSPRLEAIADGNSIDTDNLRAMAYHGEVALIEMNTAVWLYEAF
tara:strand:- start:2221 stop:3117 length:897 start_codon:yes stop_codon:yes gene_type:complete